MGAGAEFEAVRFARGDEAPAGQHLGEVGDVGLGVARGGGDGVQFEDLARQVLVEAAPRALAGGTLRADRVLVVEVGQHGRVADHGQQHVLEPAGDVGADGVAHIDADQRAHLGAGHGEMVGPEGDQAFAQAVGRFDREGDRGGGFLGGDAPAVGPAHAGAGAGGILDLRQEDGAQRGGQVGGQGWAGQAGGELRLEPGGRVGGHGVRRAAAVAEADRGDDGGGIHGGPCIADSGLRRTQRSVSGAPRGAARRHVALAKPGGTSQIAATD